MYDDSAPKLSDLVRDWAEAGGWPITVRQSVQYPMLYWIESKQLIRPIDPPSNNDLRGYYIGTIHNDDAYFAPSTLNQSNYFDAADPDFFKLLGECIISIFKATPHLDKSALPHE